MESWRGANGGASLPDDPRRQKAWDLPIVKRNWDNMLREADQALEPDYWPRPRKRVGLGFYPTFCNIVFEFQIFSTVQKCIPKMLIYNYFYYFGKLYFSCWKFICRLWNLLNRETGTLIIVQISICTVICYLSFSFFNCIGEHIEQTYCVHHQFISSV